MSLWFYLEGEARQEACECDCGHQHTRMLVEDVYDANITHNLAAMAVAAGVYGCVWRPEENGVTQAKQLIEPLRAGIAAMKAEPEKFKAHNPPNGWGDYNGFVKWLESLLSACEAHPEAKVKASR